MAAVAYCVPIQRCLLLLAFVQLGAISVAGMQTSGESIFQNFADNPDSPQEPDIASLLQEESAHPDEDMSGAQVSRHHLSASSPTSSAMAFAEYVMDEISGAAASLIAMENGFEPKPEVVMHKKGAGSGYQKGSPLYGKQQEMTSKQPVSTSMKCIIGLTAQFFAVYTILFITHSINRMQPTALPRLEKCLMSIAKTLYFIPMLCVLFLATRMRAVQLAQGMTHQHDLPQFWVKWAMITCSMAVTLQTVIAAFYYAILSKDPESARGGNPSTAEQALNYARYLVIGCLYLGFMIVCIGVWLMPAPTEIWGESGGPKVSPAVVCTIFLATLYFLVHFCIGLAESLDEFLTPEAMTVDVAPMLCILFVSARLRALQLDPREGNPQAWAQAFFYISSFSVLGLLILCLAAAFLLQKEGFQSPPSVKIKAAEVLRSLFMFLLYIGAIAVIFSMFLLERENGPTPSVPPSMKCVMILNTAYFFVYSALWVTTTMKKLNMPAATAAFVINLSDFLEKFAKDVIDVCPMLCVLFLGTFLRALQITGNQGAPQPWAQVFMYIGTTSVVLMTLSRIDLLLFKPTPDGNSPPSDKPPSRSVMPIFLVLQHVCLFLMHVSVIVVITALLTMTPENAKGAGSIWAADEKF